MMKLGTVIPYQKKIQKIWGYGNLNFTRIWQEKPIFWGLLSVLGMALKFYNSMAKGLKLKVIIFWGLIPKFVKIEEKNW